MNASGGWNSRQRRGTKSKTIRNKTTQEKTQETTSAAITIDERKHRPCQNRTPGRRRKGWSPPSDGACVWKAWNLHDGLKRWKEAGRRHERYFYGTGGGQVVLERDTEEGYWKVMTVPGYRFSPLWLDAIQRWASDYRKTLLELNKASSMDVNDDRSTMGSIDSVSSNKDSLTDASTTKRQGQSVCSRQSGRGLLVEGKVCISLRCERMGLTDVEMDMITKWYEQHASVLSIVKLWLFDNKITDSGARHIAQLVNNELLEIHVSHNSITNSGARQIMTAAASTRTASSKPFWLRMEWNMINHEELKQFITEMEKDKGVIVDIPRFHLRRSRGKAASCLINEHKVAHLRLPWIQCQRLSPSEAPVLMQAKSSWQENTNNAMQNADIPSPSHSNRAEEATALPANPKGNAHPLDACSSGPLLIFPDTSALLGLIGCKVKTGSSPFLNFEWLDGLCQKGHFGRSVPANERVFFVLCDSVMKQLDGLKKHSAHVGLCVRKLVNSGLEKYGPAGQDFLTILGAHEGEGIIVDRNAEVLDSRSQHVFNKGQAIDLKIVEVALFFQQELCQAASQFRMQVEQMPGKPGQLPNPNNPFCFPVVLFSNDNVQLMAAKSHGLPAFRYTDLQKCTHSKEVMHGRKPLTASVLRNLIGKKATIGLGARARKSLQDEFDGIVACMKHLMDSYEDARNLLEQAREILEGNSEDTLDQLRQLLDVRNAVPSRRKSSKPKASICSEGSSIDNDEIEEESIFRLSLESSPATSTSGMDENKASDSSVENDSNDDTDDQRRQTIPLVRAKLVEWERLVRSYQHPSRILRWTSGHLYSD